ncbi:MAG: hypothetical protein L3J88_10935 [Gammaproteobacteria bacterium]|nr:hypothetical protein [Gammaproteobacteria bacterium]MCF6363832.1 hypothetical protein [Gammaproteobacteria bacterium]
MSSHAIEDVGDRAQFLTELAQQLMLFGHYWQRFEPEAEYLQIDIKQRELLESIPQLKKPFRLFDTLSQLNIR